MTTRPSSPYSSSSHRCSSLSVPSTTQQLADIVVTAAESSRKINKQAANIAQLRVSNMKLHGRDDEIKLLRSKLRELEKDDDEEDAAQNIEQHDGKNPSEKSTNSNLILVSGISGTGKSALIHKGLGEYAIKCGYTFASGKFDEKLPRPLSAFSDAMDCLAECIQMANINVAGSSISALIRDQIRYEFDEEDVELLWRVLPGCTKLLGAQRTSLSSRADSVPVLSRSRTASSSQLRRRSLDLMAGKESIPQMHYGVKKLLKIICSYLKGTVLFIDDLQWSDTSTLGLLKSIVVEGEISNLMIIGAYREDEVPEHHPLSFHIRDLEHMNVSITRMKIGSLTLDNVISLVAEALGMNDDDNKVITLAETIHKKTEGNPFFILTFLRSLHDEKLLQYNFGTLKWTWDSDAVNAKMVAENVASVLVEKMNRLHEETQMGLMVASCLGSSFHLSALVEVMNNVSPVEIRSSMRSNWESASLLRSDEDFFNSDRETCDSSYSYASSIEELEEEGLCEIDNEECHFMHDQIQSAAFDLISPEERDSFQGRIGKLLLKSLSPEDLDASLFEVVGLMNCSTSNTDEERDLLARLNLEAGIKASENAAFDAAKVYFKAGHDALGSRGWQGDHSTMLDLCSHGANVFYVTGDFDLMNEHIDEVLSKDIDTKEKFRVSYIKALSLFTAGKLNESIDTALDFRRQLGLPIVKRKTASKFTILKEYIRVMMLLKNKTAEDIADLPLLNDERHEMGQRFNYLLTSPVYNVLGTLLCGPFGKPHKGLEMAKAAELILEKPGFRRNADTRFVAQYFCYHWVSPLQDSIEPLLKGYQIGLETGENESAGFCLFGRGYHLYFIGRPLDSIQKELEVTVSVFTQLKQGIVKCYSMILLVTAKRLRGIDIEAGEKILDSIEANNNIALTSYINVMKLEVLVFFQEWREAIDLVRKAGNIRFILSCTFASARYTFLEALAHLKVAQSASGWKRRQMKKRAQKAKQIISGWAKNGNVNVVHHLQILDAELAVLDGKSMQAKTSFNAAIATSRRNGLIQDRALAHELASAYFQAQGDDHWRDYHIECAKTCYQEWGCSEKVKQLM